MVLIAETRVFDHAMQPGAPAAAPEPLDRIAIRALAAAGSFVRIIDLFAQRDILPRQLLAQQDGDWLLIDLLVAIADDAVADLLLHKLRAMVGVDRALLVRALR